MTTQRAIEEYRRLLERELSLLRELGQAQVERAYATDRMRRAVSGALGREFEGAIDALDAWTEHEAQPPPSARTIVTELGYDTDDEFFF